jgi:hypothetical protein
VAGRGAGGLSIADAGRIKRDRTLPCLLRIAVALLRPHSVKERGLPRGHPSGSPSALRPCSGQATVLPRWCAPWGVWLPAFRGATRCRRAPAHPLEKRRVFEGHPSGSPSALRPCSGRASAHPRRCAKLTVGVRRHRARRGLSLRRVCFTGGTRGRDISHPYVRMRWAARTRVTGSPLSSLESSGRIGVPLRNPAAFLRIERTRIRGGAVAHVSTRF